MNLATVILAAGKGTRMKSDLAKVLHAAAGRPMIEYPVRLARALGSDPVVAVLGHQADQVGAVLDEGFGAGAVHIALQHEQRGTGHAVAQAESVLRGFDGHVLILYGDVPGLGEATVRRLVDAAMHKTLALVAVRLAEPRGYGRLVRHAHGHLARIVEEKDCTPAERAITEVNAGIYCVRAGFLFAALQQLTPDNAQGELYLTDVVARAAEVEPVVVVEADADEVMGVNDRVELDRADRLLRRRKCEALMRDGVTLRQPETCRIDVDVTVGRDTEIGPNVQLLGKTVVGARARIDAGSILSDTTVADDAHVKPYTVVESSRIGPGAQVGPFAHLRPGSDLGAHVKVGNFVETKKTKMGDGAKASHLTYLGDAVVGRDVNVGCGTITCNYDGYKKYETVIEDGAFIGSDTQLVAPVRVGAHAVVAAGTTVTRDVPPGALALTRVEQKHVEGYAEKKRKKMKP